MKAARIYILFLVLLFAFSSGTYAQIRKSRNQPFADQKLFHLGFMLGVNFQDMILAHTGYTGANGETWFAEIPSYSAGFSVGIVADQYINGHMNLRAIPTLHFGERRFVFKEQRSGEEFSTSVRGNYLSLPLLLKFSADRMDNFRPYLIGGGYASLDLSPKKDDAIRLQRVDYGLEFGIGCNIYFPLFKLCPELKFSFGLKDLINHDRSDLTNQDLLKYTQALSSGRSRMISLVFNFE